MSSQDLPMSWPEDVRRFWFEELTQQDWFRSDSQLDERIRQRFAEVYAKLKNSPPSPDGLDAKALLAAVIVFDQFPRNIFRSSLDAYATDQKALELARHAVASGKDRSLEMRERHFLYMPYMHSEDLAAQAESVRLFTALGIEEGVKYARHHHDVIERFGRFPHRNVILGRRSTPEEMEFLKNEPPLM